MFTQHIPRAAIPAGKSTHSPLTRAGAALGALALGAGIMLVAPVAANAEDVASSYAEGQFLSGTLLGTDLANIVALGSAEARNNGTQDKQTSKDALHASVIQTIDVNAPNGVQVPLDDFIDAGAVNQYAEADRNGVSFGASGAIGDDGVIGAGAVGSGAAGDLDLDLGSQLSGSFDSVLTDLTLSLDAVAAQARGDLNVASGDYRLDGATLVFTSPAIGDLGNKVNTALESVDDSIADLDGENGILGLALDDILNPILATIGSEANVSASITSDVHQAVQPLLTGVYGNGATRFNLQTGTVTMDLEQLHGGTLNNLPVNTEILSDAVISQVLQGITETVTTLADQIVDKVSAALHNAQVDVRADLDLLSSPGSTQGQVCRDIQVPIIGNILGGVVDDTTGGLGGLLDGLRPGNSSTGTVQGIVGYTTETVCEVVESVLPALRSTVNVDVRGTVDQILSGVAAEATASVSLLGGTVNAALDVNGILDGLATGLTDGLFDSDGAVAGLVESLNIGLVDPAETGLLGTTGVGAALTDVLSVRVNLQERSTAGAQDTAIANGSLFTQTAVRVSVLQGAGDLATLSLAAATVGPNITQVVDPGCTVNCGPGVDPDPCVVNCGPGGPGGPGDSGTPTTTAADRLAYTGVGIATLIAVILALLAAGAYMAREGYRRNHTESLVGA